MSQRLERPTGYVVCTVAEGGCPLSATCLRSKIHHESNAATNAKRSSLRVVNLWNETLKTGTNACAMYRTATQRRFARGFTSLFDAIPQALFEQIKAEVEQVFSSRRIFYYCRKGERLTSPEEQQQIADIFQKYGFGSAPRFDDYVETYDWAG